MEVERMTDMERAEKRILDAASTKRIQSSARVLEAAEKTQPPVSPNVLRVAYWTLVSEGKLERTTKGVRKVK
jgi:hypothetical protein